MTDDDLGGCFVLVVGLAVSASLVLGDCDAAAQAPERTALALAQVCVNEAGWDSPADCGLIWGAAERHASPLRWLRRHSGRVLGTRPCSAGNCLWTRSLAWSDRKPRGWPLGVPWQPARWRAVREHALRLVTGEDAARPCAEAPETWDGPAWRARALAAGFREVVCVGTRNIGYVRRRR